MSDDPNLTETIRVLETACAAEGAPASMRVHLAKLLLSAGRHADATAACRVILDEDPGDVDALELGARALRALGRTAQADRYLAVATRLGESEPADAAPPNAVVAAPTNNVVPLRVVRGETDEGDLERPTVKLADVAGMAAVKRRLTLSFLGPLKNPELRALYGKSLRGGLLLWGPPGCGKTFLARAIAGELGAKFTSIGLDEVLDMYTGQSEKHLHALFERARRQAPCVLFFDEIDALGQKRGHLRGSASRNVVAQLLSELDGVSDSNEGVFVLGATNHPWDVDTALRRPGRLDRTLLVLPPDASARESILRMNLAGRPTDALDLHAVARMTARYSGADLVQIVESAAELALESAIETGTARPIVQSDLLAAVRDSSDSTSAWLSMARNYAEFADDGGSYDDLLDYLRTAEGPR